MKQAKDLVPEWRGVFANEEVNRLHAEAFRHALSNDDWWAQVNRHSLGWVCLRFAGRLIGFVNVAWDGGMHAFLLDTMIVMPERRKGHAARMIKRAVTEAKSAGCEWLHVDFTPDFRAFYLDACGFRPTDAGVIALK